MAALLSSLGRFRGQAAPIAAISVFGLAISMSYPLLGLLLERMGASGAAIGFNTMAAAIMMVVSAPLLPRILAVVGLAPLMVGSAGALVGLMLLFPLVPDYWWWTAFRLIYGFAATALFFCSEYWIVAGAPAASRGRVVALYTISLSVTFMMGPLIVSATGVDGILPFAIASGILALGIAPILWGLGAMPPKNPEAPPRPLSTLGYFVSDPGILFGVVLFGVIEYGLVALLPVWAVRVGHSETEAAIALASFAAGAVLFQPGVGWAADRFDRRKILALAAAVSVAAPLGLTVVAETLWLVIAITVIWGGMAVALYAVALTELGARYSGTTLSEGNAAVVLAYGLGALISPIGLGIAMDLVPPNGIMFAAAAAAMVYTGLIVWRIRSAPTPA